MSAAHAPTGPVLALLTGGKGTRSAPTPTNDARALLGALYAQQGTWRKTAQALKLSAGVDINPGYLSQVARGLRPAGNTLRSALGLPDVIAVTVCPHCHQAPLQKRHRCPAAPATAKPTRPKIQWKRLYTELAALLLSCEILP